MKRDWFGFLMMAAGVAGIAVGGRMASGGETFGWIRVGGGLVLLIAAYLLMMRPTSAEAPATSASEAATDATLGPKPTVATEQGDTTDKTKSG